MGKTLSIGLVVSIILNIFLLFAIIGFQTEIYEWQEISEDYCELSNEIVDYSNLQLEFMIICNPFYNSTESLSKLECS